MAKVASLLIDMQVETAAVRKGLEANTAQLQKFGKSASTISKTLIGALSFGAALRGAKDLIRYVNDLGKTNAQLAGQLETVKAATDKLNTSIADFLTRTGVSGTVTKILAEAFEGAAFWMSEGSDNLDAMINRTNELTSATEALTKERERLVKLQEAQNKLDEEWRRRTYDEEIRKAQERVAAAEARVAQLRARSQTASAATVAAGPEAREAAPPELDLTGDFSGTAEWTTQILRRYLQEPLASMAPALKRMEAGVIGVSVAAEDLAPGLDFRPDSAINGAAISQLGSGLASRTSLGSMMGSVAEGAAMGGPAGGFAAAITSILSESTQFAAITSTLNETFGAMADIAGGLLEPLMPLVNLLRDFYVALKPVGALLGNVLRPIIEGITEALRWLWTGVLTVANFLGGQGANSFSNAIDSLAGSIKHAAGSLKELAAEANDTGEGLLNAAAGFRVERYRYDATNTGGSSPSTGGGGMGGPTIPPGGSGPGGGQQPGGDSDTPPINIHLHGSTFRDWMLERDRDQYRNGGTRVALVPRYA